jgi:hypothetical protein
MPPTAAIDASNLQRLFRSDHSRFNPICGDMGLRPSGAWTTALLTGDARAVGHALKIAGYCTASEEQYVATLASIAAKLDGELPDARVALAPDRTTDAVGPAA